MSAQAVAVKPGTPRLRADATRNRERILAAAQEAFVELGPEVPLDEIARRAGIGNATLYRHFSGRRELVTSVVMSVLATMAEQTKAILADSPDAFTALEAFVHGAVDWKIGALCPMLSEWMNPADPDILAARDRLDSVVADVIDRAKAEGTMRADVGPGDIMVVASQIGRPLPGLPTLYADHIVHRHLQIVLDGLRAPQWSVLPGRSIELNDIRDGCVITPRPQQR